MTLVQRSALWLARTSFGRQALTGEADLKFFKTRPTPRIYFGLSLIALSYLTSLPGLALCGYLAQQRSEPLIMVIGGGAVLVIVHIIFILGVYLAGANYAEVVALWALGKFLKKHLA